MVYTTFDPLSNEIKIISKFSGKKFRNFIGRKTLKRSITCESHSSVKTGQKFKKISGYMQFDLLYKLVKKKSWGQGGGVQSPLNNRNLILTSEKLIP
jgi:hypothetical protein